MQIDLTNPDNLTIENVAKLIASKDDSENRQLRVTSNGIAFISDEVGSQNTDGLAFRFETFGFGNGYTGLKASQDQAWVTRIHKALEKNWPESQYGSYIDVF